MGRPQITLKARVGKALASAMLALAGAPTATADPLEVRGALELEGRLFFVEDEAEPTGSLAGTLELFKAMPELGLQFVGEFFWRQDDADDNRSHGDLRQAFVQALARDVEISVGWQRVFWGVTESRSLVNVVNQTDLVEDIDGEAKLGQPMARARWFGPVGAFDAMLLIGTPKRTIAGPDGFPRVPFPVITGASRFPGDERSRLDYALRWTLRKGPFDIGLSWFDGTARNPDFLPCLAEGSDFPNTEDGPNCNLQDAVPEAPKLPPVLIHLLRLLQLAPTEEEVAAEVTRKVLDNLVLVPEYDREKRAGIDMQYLAGGLALRLEALARRRDGRWTLATVAGLEYALPRLANTGWASDWDVNVLFEHLFDERDEDPINQRFANDLFFGTTVAFNDLAGTLFIAGVLTETDFSNRLFNIELSRRFGPNWRAALTARVFNDLPDNPIVELLDGQDQVRLQITRFF